MTEAEKIRVNTLSDDPVSVDAFGSHQKIAVAIKNMVENEEGGKAIALEGTWGSGKSTVVKILSDLCEKERTTKQGTLVFTFDSWAHCRDPLRRSFFEKAIEKLEAAVWTTTARWKDSIDTLAGRGKETTTTQARINTMALVYSIAIALAPLGLVILNKQVGAIELEPTLGLILSALPAVLVGLATVFWILAYIIGIFDGDCKESILRFLSPVNSKVDSTVVTSTVRTNDPTSIEFRKEFRKLLNVTLKAKERRLVIVVDNLDRVGDETALSIWSNLRTFFQFDDAVNTAWGKRVWLLVPYSQSGISRLWDKGEKGTSESFEAKTFQIKFHVPQPVLSDWDTYFMKQLDRAFYPNLPESEAHAVCSVFRQEVYPGVDSPTPRDIKAFINRIGTLIRYRGSEIHPEILARYAALETEKSSESKPTPSELKLLNTIFEDMVGKDYQAELIALHYGVTESVARQLLLWKPLGKAIETGDPAPLRESQNIDGFTICCAEYVGKVVQHQTDFVDSYNVATAAFVFAQLEIDEDRHWRKMWELLRDAARCIELWKTFDATTGEGMAKLIERNKGTDLGTKFLESISNSKSLFQDKEGNAHDDDSLLAALRGISVVIRSLASIQYSPLELELLVTPATYHHVMRLLIVDTDNASLAQYVVPKGDRDQVLATITVAMGKGEYDDTDYRLLELWFSQDEEWKLETIIPNIEARLTTDQVSHTELRPLLRTLLLLHDSNPATEALKRLTAGAHILSPFGRLYGSLDIDDRAVCVYLTLLHNPDGATSAQPASVTAGRDQYAKLLANPNADTDLLEATLRLYLEYSNPAELLTHVDRVGDAGTFCKALVNTMVGKEDVVRLFTPDQVIDYQRILHAALESEPYEGLIQRFTEETDLIEKLLARDFDAELTTLYLAVLTQVKDKMRAEIQEFLSENLRKVDHQRWSEEIDIDYISIFDLVVALSKNDVQLRLGISYRDALRQLVGTHLKSDSENPRLLSMWRYLILGLNDSQRNTFLREYLDKIITPPPEVAVERLVTLFKPELISCKLLEDKADDLVRTVLRRILDSQSGEELDWLHQTLLTCPNVSKKCHQDTTKAFQDEIRNFLSEESELSDEFRAKIEKISELLDAASS